MVKIPRKRVIKSYDVEMDEIPINASINAKDVWHKDLFYAKRNEGPWKLCLKEFNDVNKNTGILWVRFICDDTKRQKARHEIACGSIPTHSELTIFTRVIATRNQKYLPYKIDKNKSIALIFDQPGEFYPGIIAAIDCLDYCIFFDDGVVQFVKRNQIRIVEGQFEPCHAHPNASAYFKFYLSQTQFRIEPHIELCIKVELNGLWNDAVIVERDRILAKIHFIKAHRFEWIYLNSPRILKSYREQAKFYKNDPSQQVTIEDISGGKEQLPIPVRGEVSLEDSFKYITNLEFKCIIIEPRSDLRCKGCDCIDGCRDKIKCSCWQLTIQRYLNRQATEEDLFIGYNNMRLYYYIKSGIVECGENCQCIKDKCVNRVAQQGLQFQLELFKTLKCGWGVRTETDLPPGIFICIFAGDVMTESMANKKFTKYQFGLPDIDSEFNSEPKSKKQPRTRNDHVIQKTLNYFPSTKNVWTKSEANGSSAAHEYIIETSSYGNFTRFFNHSCSPNMFVQTVYIDNDSRFPRYAFFTSRAVKANQELTFDYNFELTNCLCGAENCKGLKQ